IDVTLPLDRMAEFADELEGLLADEAPGADLYLFGHIADGGLHVNIVSGRDPGDVALDHAVMKLTAAFGGSISAEHGIGRAKRPALGLVRTEEELEAMRTIRDAFDPDRMLNPGVLL